MIDHIAGCLKSRLFLASAAPALKTACWGGMCMLLQGSALQTVMIYANSMNTEIRAKLKLRSTSRGANNRLDVESIVSFDKADGISIPVISMPNFVCSGASQCTSAGSLWQRLLWWTVFMRVPAALARMLSLLGHHFRHQCLMVAVVCLDDIGFGWLGLTEHLYKNGWHSSNVNFV